MKLPPSHSSTPASAPCECTASVIRALSRMSFASHSRAKGWAASSEVGWTEQYSVHTTPQPPSALVARMAASIRGRLQPMPEQWGT